MATLSKRATVYFDPVMHKTLRVKSMETERSISDIIDEALRHELAEDAEDIADAKRRKNEPSVSYEALLGKLKRDGKI